MRLEVSLTFCHRNEIQTVTFPPRGKHSHYLCGIESRNLANERTGLVFFLMKRVNMFEVFFVQSL